MADWQDENSSVAVEATTLLTDVQPPSSGCFCTGCTPQNLRPFCMMQAGYQINGRGRVTARLDAQHHACNGCGSPGVISL